MREVHLLGVDRLGVRVHLPLLYSLHDGEAAAVLVALHPDGGHVGVEAGADDGAHQVLVPRVDVGRLVPDVLRGEELEVEEVLGELPLHVVQHLGWGFRAFVSFHNNILLGYNFDLTAISCMNPIAGILLQID